MSDIEKEFFEAMKIKPTMLCQCSFKNLKDYRYEYGDDCCEHLDDFEFSCKDCEKSIQNIPLYPTITSDIVLGLMQIILEYIDKNNCETLHINDGQFYFDFYSVSGENIKECVLQMCIKLEDKISEEVKALFKC